MIIQKGKSEKQYAICFVKIPHMASIIQIGYGTWTDTSESECNNQSNFDAMQ